MGDWSSSCGPRLITAPVSAHRPHRRTAVSGPGSGPRCSRTVGSPLAPPGENPADDKKSLTNVTFGAMVLSAWAVRPIGSRSGADVSMTTRPRRTTFAVLGSILALALAFATFTAAPSGAAEPSEPTPLLPLEWNV